MYVTGSVRVTVGLAFLRLIFIVTFKEKCLQYNNELTYVFFIEGIFKTFVLAYRKEEFSIAMNPASWGQNNA
jgi:hypothetical protein